MYILGAGMAGCIAAILNGDAIVFERAATLEDIPLHKALLRFRSDKIARICGMEFKKVRVRKSIFYKEKEYRQPTIQFLNMYSRKVTGGYYDRSIGDLGDCERYIAPENFHATLLERCKSRIQFDSPVKAISRDTILTSSTECADELIEVERGDEPVVSTLPMSVNARMVWPSIALPKFGIKKIWVARVALENCDVHQTMYFPDSGRCPYRVSIVGSQVIAEFIEKPDSSDYAYVMEALGMSRFIQRGNWLVTEQAGKIRPITEDFRKKIIYDLSAEYNIYSLGRYSVWRNILLDDVYDDALQIRRLINQSNYDMRLGNL